MFGTTKLKNSGIYLCLCLLKASCWLWHTIRRVDIINLSLAVCVYLVRTQINSAQLFAYIVSSSSCFWCGFDEYSLVTVTHTRIREKKNFASFDTENFGKTRDTLVSRIFVIIKYLERFHSVEWSVSHGYFINSVVRWVDSYLQWFFLYRVRHVGRRES